VKREEKLSPVLTVCDWYFCIIDVLALKIGQNGKMGYFNFELQTRYGVREGPLFLCVVNLKRFFQEFLPQHDQSVTHSLNLAGGPCRGGSILEPEERPSHQLTAHLIHSFGPSVSLPGTRYLLKKKKKKR